MTELAPIRLTCPACRAPILLPLTQQGADLTSITLAIDLGAVRAHIAQHQEPAMSALAARFHDLVTALESEGHHLAGEARAVLSHYEQDAQAVASAVKPIVDGLHDKLSADVKDAIGEVKTALAEILALLKQQPAGS